jgi:hypothetical protein
LTQEFAQKAGNSAVMNREIWRGFRQQMARTLQKPGLKVNTVSSADKRTGQRPVDQYVGNLQQVGNAAEVGNLGIGTKPNGCQQEGGQSLVVNRRFVCDSSNIFHSVWNFSIYEF